jgi:hypothetical protein
MYYDTQTTYPRWIETTCFDNEGEGDAAAQAAAAAASKAAEGEGDEAGKQSPVVERKFTQEQVNKMVGTRNKALQEKYQVLEGTYTELLEQTNLSDAAREKLEGELEAVQAQMRTKEQQLEFEQKKAQNKFDSELAKANEKGDYYQNLFESSVTNRGIADAAMANDGCNAQDFIDKLGPKTQVVIELDSEGQKTGELVPMVDWVVTDPTTGQKTQVRKTPDEVVKLMQEDKAQYGHLFRSNVAQGVGAGTAQASPALTGGKIDHSAISDEEFFELSKTEEGLRALGLKN